MKPKSIIRCKKKDKQLISRRREEALSKKLGIRCHQIAVRETIFSDRTRDYIHPSLNSVAFKTIINA